MSSDTDLYPPDLEVLELPGVIEADYGEWTGQSLADLAKTDLWKVVQRMPSRAAFPGGSMTGISRKLPDTERKRLRDVLKKLVPEGAGVIVRTAAEGASEDELARDVKRLQAQWEDIQAKAAEGGAPVLLYEEPDLVIRVVRDLFPVENLANPFLVDTTGHDLAYGGVAADEDSMWIGVMRRHYLYDDPDNDEFPVGGFGHGARGEIHARARRLQRDGETAGADRFVSQPFDPDQLIATIRKVAP